MQVFFGATGRTRTDGLRITNALLYQLSHSSINAIHFVNGRSAALPSETWSSHLLEARRDTPCFFTSPLRRHKLHIFRTRAC